MNTDNLPTAKNLRTLGRYFWPLHFVWWTITQWWTRPKGPIDWRAIDALPEVPRYSYAKDKPFDFMRHPITIGERTALGLHVGDCDDFAAWRAYYRLSEARGPVYVAILKFKRAAHTVTIWKADNGEWVWADYGAPFKTASWADAPPVIAIGQRVAIAHNRTPLVGVAFARVRLRAGGALRFGRVKVGTL